MAQKALYKKNASPIILDMKISRFAVIAAILFLGGCASMINSATSKMAHNLSRAMLDQNDPETVRAAMPAYLVMLDSLAEGDPHNVDMLLSASRLYGAYTSAFINDEARARRLADKSLDYARRALCIELERLCQHLDDRLDPFTLSLKPVTLAQQPVLYGYASSWAGWIKLHGDDWNALAQIPKLTAMFKRSAQLNPQYDHGGAYLYLGVLAAQIPPSLGGKPQQARRYFEKAQLLSAGKNLMVDVLFAEHYARLVFDQPLHDRLLKQVLAADPKAPGLTLINTLAQQRAAKLLSESEDFF